MNLEFQKEFLLRKDIEPLYDGFDKVDNFRVEKFDCVYDSLKSFLKKNENQKLIILSKWCKNIKGLKFEAAFRSLVALGIRSHTHPFLDQDYLSPKGKHRDVLIPYSDICTVAKFFDLTKKEFKMAVNNWGVLFSLHDYSSYILKRKKMRAKEQSQNEEYFKKISFDGVSFFKKEYISTHKYASNFLQSFVENNKRNITEGEKAAQKVLDEMGVEFEFQKPCLIAGHSYIMDFYIEKYGVCIEIDGGYHNTAEQLLKDRERTNILAKSGVLVVRFSNEEAMNGSSIKTFLLHIYNEI